MFLLIQMVSVASNKLYIALNSIMFLLILEKTTKYNVKGDPLNSIMFLLIQRLGIKRPKMYDLFKFHYVSINSPCVTNEHDKEIPL